MHVVRYADDFVLVFRSEDDARRVLAVLPKRFAEFGLKLHPSKTKLIDFRQPSIGRKQKPKESFEFLGFSLFWGRSRKGGWIVQWKTANDRFSRSVARIGEWCRRHRHAPLRWQQQVLNRKLQGHYGCYGLTGNFRASGSFRDAVRRLWCKWLGRRHRRAPVFWTKSQGLEAPYPLLRPRVVHSVYRHAANLCSEEPDASIAHVRICGRPGGAISRVHPARDRHASIEKVLSISSDHGAWIRRNLG